MSESNFMHENFHTKHSVFTAPDAVYIMSIQPANKAVTHLINSYD